MENSSMSSSMVEFMLLAAIALFIGWRLFVTLGQDNGPPDGRERPAPGPVRPQSGAQSDGPSDVVEPGPTFTGPAAAGMEAIHSVDNSFDPRGFLQGARAAYEMIVAAYARGDRAALKPLLDTDVYEAWDAAIAEREKTGSDGMTLLRLRKAEISDASLGDDGTARVTVHFESELGDGEITAKAKELWTFMRQTRNDDPNWLLDDVDTAD
ncbi:MAG: Tim44/TimA family putative adaptor protein [Henriciella sp.]|nr:Tim44/TimA family putative adaptor protein [Henriciella sp.]